MLCISVNVRFPPVCLNSQRFYIEILLDMKKSHLAQNGFPVQHENCHLWTKYTERWRGLMALAAAVPESQVLEELCMLRGEQQHLPWSAAFNYECVSSALPAWYLNLLSITGNISISKGIRMRVNGGLYTFASVSQNLGLVNVRGEVNEESLSSLSGSLAFLDL